MVVEEEGEFVTEKCFEVDVNVEEGEEEGGGAFNIKILEER